MKRVITVLTFFLMVVLLGNVQAQDDTDSTKKAAKQAKHNVLSVEGWLSKLGIKIKDEEETGRQEYGNKPFVGFNYAYSKIASNTINQPFRNTGRMELSLGYESVGNSGYSERIKDLGTSFLRFAFLKDNLSHKKDNDVLKGRAEMWRIYWGRSSGSGIDFYSGNLIIPYYSYGVNWSSTKFSGNSYVSSSRDSAIIRRYDDVINFGTTVETGLRLKLGGFVSMNAGYEKSLVFPYVLTWKQSGSYLFDVIGMALIDEFFDHATSSSPYAATICKYVLQGGLLYSMAQLRHEKMAWPFKSAAPLYYDSFTFGVSLSF